jgi:hypothetical protein
MRTNARSGRLAIVLTLLVGAAVAFGTPRAAAVDTPIYNAPAGGGAVQEITIKRGPFILDPQGGAHDQDEGAAVIDRPPGAFAVKSARFDLVDENGDPVGRHDVHLHHFVIAALNEVDPACPGREVFGIKVRPLIGTGMERTPLDFADPYAMNVAQNEAWGAQWHFMNMSGVTQKFWITYTLGIQTGATTPCARPRPTWPNTPTPSPVGHRPPPRSWRCWRSRRTRRSSARETAARSWPIRGATRCASSSADAGRGPTDTDWSLAVVA